MSKHHDNITNNSNTKELDTVANTNDTAVFTRPIRIFTGPVNLVILILLLIDLYVYEENSIFGNILKGLLYMWAIGYDMIR